MLTKRMIPNHRYKCFLSPTPRYHITIVLFTAVPFTWNFIQEKLWGIFNGKKIQSEEIKQALEPDSYMAGILELSGQEFKTFIDLIDKVDSMQEQMDNVSWVMGSLRKKQKEMQEIQNTVTEMRNAFDGLISKLEMAKKEFISLRISEEK